jgi:hypothetical protein
MPRAAGASAARQPPPHRHDRLGVLAQGGGDEPGGKVERGADHHRGDTSLWPAA